LKPWPAPAPCPAKAFPWGKPWKNASIWSAGGCIEGHLRVGAWGIQYDGKGPCLEGRGLYIETLKETRMKLSRISIERLFGQFDYDIELNQKDGITILTGPNGYGKTTILNIIWSLFHAGLRFYEALPFSVISMFFSDKRQIIIKKNSNVIKFFDTADNKEEYISFFQDLFSVYFIREQRLLKDNGGERHTETIRIFSRDISDRIKKLQTEELKLSADLNAAFAKRLFAYTDILSDDEFKERYERMSQKYRDIQDCGIYQNSLDEIAYHSEDKKALSIYLEDWEKKTSVYDEILAKIGLFLEFINNKGLVNKKASVKADTGFSFTTLNGSPLKLTDLSTGEQHQIIMLYELLFRVPPGSLVLIDEPESSMHVAWQLEFIQDLRKIAETKPLSFIIATHSPDIINENRSIDLYELVHGNAEDDDE
jgi:predicted ATPase